MAGRREFFAGVEDQDLRAACADSGCSVCLSDDAHEGADRRRASPRGAATLALDASARYPFAFE